MNESTIVRDNSLSTLGSYRQHEIIFSTRGVTVFQSNKLLIVSLSLFPKKNLQIRVQLTPECYIERFQVVVWQLQSKCCITVELFEVVGQLCNDLLIFSVFSLTRTSWCGGENYQGHLFIYEWLMKNYRPTTLSFIHQTHESCSSGS